MISAEPPGGEDAPTGSQGSDRSAGEKLKPCCRLTKEDGALISDPYKNFSEAELKIQSVLKEAAVKG